MATPTYDQKILLLKVSQGNEQAFKDIYDLYSPGIISSLLKLVKSEAQAKEILQEVFLKIWEHRRSIDPEKSFQAFLFKIAENKAYDYFRKVARKKNLEAKFISSYSTHYNQDENLTLAEEQLTHLHKAIDLLPPQRQQVFRLCKLEGKSYREVSEMLGISVTTVNDHIVKGTKSIRQYFDNTDGAMLLLIFAISTIK